MANPRRKLASLVIPGPPVTKKNSSLPIFVGVPKGMGRGLNGFLGNLKMYLDHGRVGKAKWALQQALRPRRAGGMAPMILPSKAYKRWEPLAIEALKGQWRGRSAIGGPDELLQVAAVFYLERMGPKTMGGDAAGYYQALSDALERAGVVTNDCYIESWAGSRRVRCPEQPRIEVAIYALSSGGGTQETIDGL